MGDYDKAVGIHIGVISEFDFSVLGDIEAAAFTYSKKSVYGKISTYSQEGFICFANEANVIHSNFKCSINLYFI